MTDYEINLNYNPTRNTTSSEEQEVAPEVGENYTSTLISLIPFIFIFIVFYFLVIRPQEQKKKELENLIATTKKGEKVAAAGGIIGVVKKINESENTILLETHDKQTLEVVKSSIYDNLSSKTKDSKDKQNS